MTAKLLLILMSFSLRCPSLESFRTIGWQPTFTDAKDLTLESSTVGFLTHSSLKFDPLRTTAPAVERAVDELKTQGHEVLYLHDRYNPGNPAWTYLYSDWSPTAYVPSDIGHIDLDLSNVRHAVCLGGFFEQCERSTVTDLIRLWRRDAPESDFRLTQVTDGVFTVLTYIRTGDWYENHIRSVHRREYTSQNRKAIITVDRVLQEIRQEEIYAEFLKRQLASLPAGINVVMDIYGVVYPWKLVDKDAPTLTLAYRRSGEALRFQPVNPDFERASRVARMPHRYYPSGRVFRSQNSSTIFPASGRIIRSYPAPTRVYPGEVIIRETIVPGSIRPPE